MGQSALPFSFSQEEQVLLKEDRLICGPGATLVGLREAGRVAARTLEIETVDAEEFSQLLDAWFQEGEAAAERDEDQLVFDVEASSNSSVQRDLLDNDAEAPVIELVNMLLRRAVRSGASDLHVEPNEDGLRARMRIDGALRVILNRSDVPVRRVVSRLKVMAGLDIAETRVPQDGRIALRLGGRAIDVRVSTLPGHYGERVVLRVLDRSAGLRPLDELGLSAEQVQLLARLAEMPNGIILSTGPTGSGKTTTLYSMLQIANHIDRNIVTIEDPIEYDLPGINQTQINSEIGMTFAAGLRAILRQDPDVILVGEIRDEETAHAAAQASLTGHLVFSTLHANGSIPTIVRLRDLNVDHFLIASTLRAIIAQRLLRQLCPSCKTVAPVEAEAAELFRLRGMTVPDTLWQAQGCPDCDGTGHAGRIGVFEIVEITEPIRRDISAGASEQDLHDLALQPQQTLLAQALKRAAEGAVSLTEVLRVVGDAR